MALVSLSDHTRVTRIDQPSVALVLIAPPLGASLSVCPGVIPALGHSVQQAGLPGSPCLPEQRRGQPAADGPGHTHALHSGGRRNVRNN